MERALHITTRLGCKLIQLHGHSLLVIQFVCNVLDDKPIQKNILSWRLENIVANIAKSLQQFDYILNEYTRQEGNGLANYLENLGWQVQGLDMDT